jgi:hypothetical protein
VGQTFRPFNGNNIERNLYHRDPRRTHFTSYSATARSVHVVAVESDELNIRRSSSLRSRYSCMHMYMQTRYFTHHYTTTRTAMR